MSAQQLDVIVRVAGATLLLLAAAVRWRRGGGAGDRYFTPLALCLCGFLAGNTPDPALQLSGVVGRGAVLLSGFTAAFLWWFCLSVFDWTFRPRGAVLLGGVAWIVVAGADRGVFGEAIAQRGLSWGLIALGLAMVGHLAWRLYRDRDGDLVDQRRRVRMLVVALLAGQLLADIAVDLVLGMDWGPRGFMIAQNAALLAFTGWLLSLDLRGDADRSRYGRQPIAAMPSRPASALGERLRVLTEVDRVHLDPALDFRTFVRRMGASERSVRDLINHQLGYDHFRTFLNAQRIAEARRLLADPARRQDKLIAIAMDSGFASLPSFNRAFQAFENTTPSAYRRAALAEDGGRPDFEQGRDRHPAGF